MNINQCVTLWHFHACMSLYYTLIPFLVCPPYTSVSLLLFSFLPPSLPPPSSPLPSLHVVLFLAHEHFISLFPPSPSLKSLLPSRSPLSTLKNLCLVLA